MLEYKRFVFNEFAENTYVIYDTKTLQAAIVDPGCNSLREENMLQQFIEQKALHVKYLINTHCHLDHIMGNKFVVDTYKPVFYAPEKDIFLLNESPNHAMMYGVPFTPSPLPDEYITEDTQIEIGAMKPKFLFTPGHSPGEYCIYFNEFGVLFSGDVLFEESIGRSDLPGGNQATLLESIHKKLLVLPDETIILPGHGENTTIGNEKMNNPFI